MEQYSILEKDFYYNWRAFAPDIVTEHYDFETLLFEVSGNAKIHLAMNACWLSLMTEIFKYWEDNVSGKSENKSGLAENPITRKKMADAWIELELTRSVHEHTLLLVETKAETILLAKFWLTRCLKIFVFDLPLYIDLPQAPWQKQAREFIQRTQ